MPYQPPLQAGRARAWLAPVVLMLSLLPFASTAHAAAGNDALRAAFEAAARGNADAAREAGLRDHPLAGWIEYAALVASLMVQSPAALA